MQKKSLGVIVEFKGKRPDEKCPGITNFDWDDRLVTLSKEVVSRDIVAVFNIDHVVAIRDYYE